MSPDLVLALHRRGVALNRTLGASVPADPHSRCAVQRIRPSCKQFTTENLEARRNRAPSAWTRLRAWFERQGAS